MSRLQNESTFRLSMSSEDWKLIDIALTAYSHNLVYRDLRDKLDMQIAMVRAMDGATRNANANAKQCQSEDKARVVTRVR